MDALSLLCTLHADGPATLQRLRGLGCGGLGAFLAMNADDLAEALSLEAAVARRLLREGRILAERLGSEALEAEEAAPVATPVVARQEAGPAAPALDEGDAALVARILSDPPAEESEAEESDADESSAASEPEPLAAEPFDLPVEEAPTEPAEEPSPVAESLAEETARALAFLNEESVEADMAAGAAQDESGPADETAGAVSEDLIPEGDEPVAPDALTVGGLPGLDSAMVEDLAAAGITTLGALGAADSLTLTRDLGVTFAQARRMRFLARRAADNLATQAVGAATGTAAEEGQEAALATVAPSEEPEQSAAPAAEDALPLETPAQDPAADAEPARDIPSQPAASAPARPPFWEPRPFLSAESAEEPQGVKVDPSEIEARPRIGDRFPPPAEERAHTVVPQSGGRTVLGWNFEIPRPAAEELPLPSFGANGAGAPDAPEEAPTEAEAQVGSDEGAGPFA